MEVGRFLRATLKGLAVVAGAAALVTAALLFISVSRVEKAPDADAEHQAPVKQWIWETWQSSWSTREVQWQNCQTLDYELNIFAIGFNNWKSRWGHNASHAYVGYNCNVNNDNMLRLWGMTAAQMVPWCPRALACFRPYVCKNAQGQYLYERDCREDGFGKLQVLKTYIIYDYVRFNYDPLLGPMDANKQMHVMIHELAHPMGLGHYHNCEYAGPKLGAISGLGCADKVDNGGYPNDVCVPDDLYGFGRSRC